MREDTRLSLLFRTESDGKLGGAWEQGYKILASKHYIKSLSSVPKDKKKLLLSQGERCNVRITILTAALLCAHITKLKPS